MSKNTSFVLGAHFDAFIQAAVESGHYASATEVVREALRDFETQKNKETWVQKALNEGLASGRAKPGVFKRLRARHARRR